MPLNPVKGNMYGFITHTWNTIKGICPHECTYCYMGRFKNLNPARFDSSELKTIFGENKAIFVGSSNDVFAKNHNSKWVVDTLIKTRENPLCSYFLQSKNPENMLGYIDLFPIKTTVCTTIESNRNYPSIAKNSPAVENRAENIAILSELYPSHITIEPILDFDTKQLVNLISQCRPKQVNIGADSSHKKSMPEPKPEKVNELIAELKTLPINVHLKPNLKRLLK